MEFKTKSGKKVKFKDVSIDEKDVLLDAVQYEYREDGSVGAAKMINSTMTKWFRLGLDGDTSDDFLKTLTIPDKTEIFRAMQEYLLLGEQKASK